MTAFWCDLARDVLLVSGPDASTYLQGQVSQDIRDLTDGQSAYTFVLQPTGKVEALARLTRRAPDEFVLDTDAGCGDVLAVRLRRFMIRVKVEITPVLWRCIAVRGSDANVPGSLPAWGRDDAFDIVAPDAHPPAGVREGDRDELEAARIEAGWPMMGREITDATIPAETGHVIARAVSFTKGCYPGQELVERMDSRGSTAPRFVRRVRGSGIAAAGDELSSAGKVVGSLTSVASDSAGGWSALALIGRAVQPGDTVGIRGRDATVEAAEPPA